MFQESHGLTDRGVTAGTKVLAFAKYQDLEKAADRTAAKIKEGFMEMGYILKVARDTDILAGSGYGNHEEFAEKRYGLDKGTVSRYIRIVERFSVGGNSHTLQEGYKSIGFAKLSLMLHMPDAIAEEITESYSKQEVQAIKEEIDAERAVSDIEVAIEAAEVPEAEKAGNLLDKAVRQLGREQQALYHRLHDVYTVEGTASMVMDLLAPQGDAVYMVRIPGTGRLMLSFSGDAASVTNVRSGEKERYSAEDVLAAVMGTMHPGPVKDSWQQEYGEPMNPASAEKPVQEGNEKTETAPVQPKEKRKESKVVKAAPPKAPARKAVKVSGGEAALEPEAPLPGQMEVMDYPEAYPMGNPVCAEPGEQIPDVHYEEILEEYPGTAGGMQADTEEPASVQKAAIPTDGAANSEGREGAQYLAEHTAASTEEKAESIRMDADGCLERLRKIFSVWNDEIPMDFLIKAHQDAIGLAAAIEGLMDIRRSAAEGSGRV